MNARDELLQRSSSKNSLGQMDSPSLPPTPEAFKAFKTSQPASYKPYGLCMEEELKSIGCLHMISTHSDRSTGQHKDTHTSTEAWKVGIERPYTAGVRAHTHTSRRYYFMFYDCDDLVSSFWILLPCMECSKSPPCHRKNRNHFTGGVKSEWIKGSYFYDICSVWNK